MNMNPSSYRPAARRSSRRTPFAALLVLLLLAAVLTACGGGTTAEPTVPAATSEIALTGGCANAFYPAVDGRVYSYSSSIAGFGMSNYTETFGDVTDNSFVVNVNSAGNEPATHTWTCSADGLLSPRITQMPIGTDVIASIQFDESEGITLPPADRLQPGESWTTHYTGEATLVDTGAGELAVTQTVDLNNEVVGIEAITVPAGSYEEAVRVDTTGAIVLSAGDGASPTTLDVNYSSWYAEGVGLVRQEFATVLGTEGANNPSVTELLSFEDQ